MVHHLMVRYVMARYIMVHYLPPGFEFAARPRGGVRPHDRALPRGAGGGEPGHPGALRHEWEPHRRRVLLRDPVARALYKGGIYNDAPLNGALYLMVRYI